MHIEISDPKQFALACAEIEMQDDEAILICLSRQHHSDLEEIIVELQVANVRFFGAIFPALIMGGSVLDTGAIVQVHALRGDPVIADLSGETAKWLSGAPDDVGPEGNSTCFVLADFACNSISDLLKDLYARHGHQVHYYGAGVGTSIRKPDAVVFDNSGTHMGAALVAYLSGKTRVGLTHGWKRMSGPIKVTEATGNIVHQLDGKPAMSVYRQIAGDRAASSLTKNVALPEAKRYPVGIVRIGMEDVVRDPVVGDENAPDDLTVLSDIAQDSILHVLHYEAENLIASSKVLGLVLGPMDQGETCLVFDCFSRGLLLEDKIGEELDQLSTALGLGLASERFEGALALGEIASDGQHPPDFHNKTLATAVFG